MEVKSGEGTVVVMEAKAGIYKDISDAARGVTSEVVVQALGNKTE